ncbi:glycoside hydrolase family 3 protein [Microbacterium sp. PMB16]|uniref:glycoside hydrolase family 3 protein n=1 Tax=Microbacterium sp. PMB16 TaxID=3120157 RepID=UPI003F4CACDD
MSLRQAAGQLLCLYLPASGVDEFIQRLRALDMEPAGYMLLPRSTADAVRDVDRLRRASRVPLLIAGNLEAGASSVLSDETIFANPMQLGATGNSASAGLLARHCARVAKNVGINWAFAPVVDIALNHRNPITNVRAFSDDPLVVAEYGARYVEAAEGRGLATSVKHFPGDGHDDRDQHLLASTNLMSVTEWEETFGTVYRRVIDAGARTVMVGHIRLPEYSRHLRPGIRDADILPASMSRELVTDLLRGQLGFEGLVVTDNSAMAGMTTVVGRRDALVLAINAGCDLILGVRDLEEDFAIILDALESETISTERVTAAVMNVLRLKASLGLVPGIAGVPVVDESEVSVHDVDVWREELADQAITLVKDTQNLLPLTPSTHRRALVYVLGDSATFYEPAHGLSAVFSSELERRGLAVDLRHIPGEGRTSIEAARLHEQYDVCFYFANVKFGANSNVLRLEWSHPQAPDAPRHVQSLPTVLVSVADPYHLQDVPMIKTAVNGYTPSKDVVRAIVARLFGEVPFAGQSPVDPFAGYWDARL